MKFCARKEVSFSWKVSILIFHEAYIAWFASISLERTKSTKNHPKFELAFSGLEELTVFVTPHGGFSVQHLSSQDPFITMISVWYALELLPGLQMRFLCHPSNFAGECSYAYAVQIFVIGNFLLKSTTCVFSHFGSTAVKKAVEPVQDYVSIVEWRGPDEFWNFLESSKTFKWEVAAIY